MSAVETKTVEEIEKSGQWWWWAEQKRSKRLDYLRKAVWKKGAKGSGYQPGVKVDLERAILFTEGFREHQYELPITAYAYGMANIFDNITIFIQDHAQIVGYLGSRPHTIVWHPEVLFLTNEDLYNDRTVIPEPEEENLRIIREICDFWNPICTGAKVFNLVPPEEIVKLLTGVIGWGLPISRIGYATKQWDYMFRLGLEGIIAEIDEKIAEASKHIYEKVPEPEELDYYEKLDVWKSMKLVLEAVIRWARRYSRLARIIAENFEKDPKRREELLRIAEVCEKVPARPPEHLQESLQFDHFIQIACRYEACEGAWPARPDYWHGPFYDKDVNQDKILTREEALDLTGEFLIRCYEVGWFWLMMARDTLQGITGTWVWTIGGVNEDGTDACNDMTDCLLEAARLVRVANPTFAFRYHPGVRIQTLRQVFECIRQGLGYPSMRNDPILITNAMHWHKHPLREARRWVHQACMSPCPDTKLGCQPFRMANATIIAAKAIEYALFNGFDNVLQMQMGPETGDASKFETFEELYQAWYTQVKWMMDTLIKLTNGGRHVAEYLDPRPLLSGLYERCVEEGVDSSHPSERGNSWITFFAWMETGDSLAAVKKLVFDEKKYTMAQLVEALKANWEGYEEMRMDFVRAPKWGNDDDYVDQIHVRCHKDVARHSWELQDPTGNPWPALPENIAAYVVNATKVWALPNGRRLGDTLYDGGCSPGAGLDKKGPTAVLRSVAKLDHIGDVRATLLNQRLSPQQLAGEKGFQIWHSYIKTWAEMGIDHVQFNMVDNETLKAAQKEPEKYPELIVRIAGYSAHFVDLNKKTQDTIIARSVQELGT
jgi:formate C-acetyltransferase/benzylsuccinate synthase